MIQIKLFGSNLREDNVDVLFISLFKPMFSLAQLLKSQVSLFIKIHPCRILSPMSWRNLKGRIPLLAKRMNPKLEKECTRTCLCVKQKLGQVHYQITLRENTKFTPIVFLDRNNHNILPPEHGCDTCHVEELKSPRASCQLLQPSTLLGQKSTLWILVIKRYIRVDSMNHSSSY